MAARKKKPTPKRIESLTHDDASRVNIPTAELQSLNEVREESQPLPPVSYPRARPLEEGERRERDEDLDPQIVWNGVRISLTPEQVAQLSETGEVEIGDAQLVWRGKDTQDWSDLVVNVPPIYVQETIHPKTLIDALRRESEKREPEDAQPDLFETLRVPDVDSRTEFYAHEQGWTNRMILGDSLQVMASLAEREKLRGKVQAIYFDPPYGIKFNSNWQVSTRSRDVKDGKIESLTREPEQVKAFRDTWRDGIHSYLTYLRDRLTVSRDLLTESGSIFVQIGDENVHRVRALMDEVFGEENLCAQITLVKTSGQTAALIAGTADYIIWYAKYASKVKFRTPLTEKTLASDKSNVYRWKRTNRGKSYKIGMEEIFSDLTEGVFRKDNITSQRPPGNFPVVVEGRGYRPGRGYWKPGVEGMRRLVRADRIATAANSLTYIRYMDDFRAMNVGSVWTDTATGNFT